jgi:hypothetical protein
MNRLEKELETYQAELPKLLKEQGKFAVVKDAQVAGVFDTYPDALKQGYERFGLEPFLVKQIISPQPVLFISRNVIPCPL